MLVATAKGGAAPAPVFQPAGNVVLGDQTRVIIDPADDALQVYYVLDIQNSARAPVNPPIGVRRQHADRRAQHHGPRRRAAGGGPRRSRDGHRTVRAGPDRRADGVSDAGYDRRRDVQQTMPARRSGLAVLMKKAATFADVAAASGRAGARIRRGAVHPRSGTGDTGRRTLALTVSGLPHHSPWPRRIALALAS